MATKGQSEAQPLQQGEPSAAFQALWEAIGYQCAQAAETGMMVPSKKLIDAMAAVEKLQQSGPVPLTDEQIQLGADYCFADDYLDFRAGVKTAERHHGITSKTEGAQP